MTALRVKEHYILLGDPYPYRLALEALGGAPLRPYTSPFQNAIWWEEIDTWCKTNCSWGYLIGRLNSLMFTHEEDYLLAMLQFT